MNIIPIAFAFDNNLTMPAAVAFTSLLKNAAPETFYDIYILHSEKEELDKSLFSKIVEEFHKCKINYVPVGNTFEGAFEIREITTPTYYRLLIPKLIPQYDKIIYADVDITFRLDLSNLYSIDLGSNYLAAAKDLGSILTEDGRRHVKTLPNVNPDNYLQAGFIMLNSALIRQDGLIDKFVEVAAKKWKFQDQDTLNIVCHDRVLFLNPKYNMTDYSFYFYYGTKEHSEWKVLYTEEDFKEGEKCGNLHFNGHKPWKKWSVNFDIWWEYYRMSPAFDEEFYFNFYYNRLNELDQLPLMKRIKLLVRYFISPPQWYLKLSTFINNSFHKK